ncbi:hypothetical protein [Gemmiger formicilis]
MEEIIVIRARDPDGVFKAVMDSLKGKRAEVVDVAALRPPCCASGTGDPS